MKRRGQGIKLGKPVYNVPRDGQAPERDERQQTQNPFRTPAKVLGPPIGTRP